MVVPLRKLLLKLVRQVLTPGAIGVDEDKLGQGRTTTKTAHVRNGHFQAHGEVETYCFFAYGHDQDDGGDDDDDGDDGDDGDAADDDDCDDEADDDDLGIEVDDDVGVVGSHDANDLDGDDTDDRVDCGMLPLDVL